MNTQKFADGSYGYVAYNSPSADSTAQAVIALNSMGIDASASVKALRTYINSATGAAKDYAGKDNTMSSYQTLLALVNYNAVSSGANGVYKYTEPVTETTSAAVTAATTDSSTSQTEKQSATTEKSMSVKIPKTGGKTGVTSLAAAFVLSCATAVVIKRKNGTD